MGSYQRITPKGNARKKVATLKLFHFQNRRCYWCGCLMIRPGTHLGVGRPDPRLCTLDHLDDRYSDERGKHPGEYRRVAACWKCNNDRNRERQETLPRGELHKRCGAFPLPTDKETADEP